MVNSNFYPPFFVQASFSANPSVYFPRQNHNPGEEELRLPLYGEGTVDGRHSCTSWDAYNLKWGIIG